MSFDDAKQIKLKAELIKDLGLAGGMVWALDLDDFKNRCGCEPSPLLRTMNRVLRNYPDGPLCTVTSKMFFTILLLYFVNNILQFYIQKLKISYLYFPNLFIVVN